MKLLWNGSDVKKLHKRFIVLKYREDTRHGKTHKKNYIKSFF